MELTPLAHAFARQHIANVIGLPLHSLPADAALESQVFHELSRGPELTTAARDQWGNWDFPFGDSNLRGELYVPWLDRPLAALRAKILQEQPGLIPEPAWPEGRPFAVCLSHDVDIVSQNPTFARSARTLLRDAGALFAKPRERSIIAGAMRGIVTSAFQMSTLRGLRPKPERSYDAWLEVEERHGFRSTFFFFPESLTNRHLYDCHYDFDDRVMFRGRRIPVREMVAIMRDGGWEIGLHGSYHSALTPGELSVQRRQIEELAQQAVVSTRQHWLHYDVRVTPILQAQAGLLADSTQGFNRNVGFRAGTAFPYACWDHQEQRALDLLEVPQHVMDGALFTANALEYDRERAVRHCLLLMDQVEAVGGCLTLSWHPNVIDHPTYWGVYEDVLAEAARRRAWGCSLAQLREWWRGREERLATPGEPREIAP